MIQLLPLRFYALQRDAKRSLAAGANPRSMSTAHTSVLLILARLTVLSLTLPASPGGHSAPDAAGWLNAIWGVLISPASAAQSSVISVRRDGKCVSAEERVNRILEGDRATKHAALPIDTKLRVKLEITVLQNDVDNSEIRVVRCGRVTDVAEISCNAPHVHISLHDIHRSRRMRNPVLILLGRTRLAITYVVLCDCQ